MSTTRRPLPAAIALAGTVVLVAGLLGAEGPKAEPAKPLTAYAVLHLAKSDKERDYEIHRRELAPQIRTVDVFKRALKKPEVAGLAVVQAHKDPLAWLYADLVIDFPTGEETVRVGLRGDKPEELAAVVNAVVDGYFEETEDTRQYLQRLKESIPRYEARIAEVLKELQEDIKLTERDKESLRKELDIHQGAISSTMRKLKVWQGRDHPDWFKVTVEKRAGAKER